MYASRGWEGESEDRGLATLPVRFPAKQKEVDSHHAVSCNVS